MKTVHFQAREADVTYRRRMKRRHVWHQRMQRGLGSSIRFNGGPKDFTVCGRMASGTRIALTRDPRKATCRACRDYITQWVR